MKETIMFPIDFSLYEGGAQNSTLEIINYLKSYFNIIILCPNGGDLLSKLSKNSNIKIYKIKFKISFFLPVKYVLKNLYRGIYLIYYIKKIIKKENVNIIHCNFPGSFIVIGSIKFFLFRKIKLIWTDRGDFDGYRAYTKLILKLALKHTDYLVTTTKSNYDKWIKYKENIYYIPNVINITSRDCINSINDANPSGKHEINIVQVGRIVRLKNYEFSINLVKYIKVNYSFDVKLDIIGGVGSSKDDLVYLKELKNLVLRENLTRNVRFRGSLKHDSLIKILKKYDLLLMTSFTESFGKVIIESFSQCLPVVSINNMGAGELLKNSCGILVDTYDYKKFADSIIRIKTDRFFRNRIIINAYNKVNKDFSIKKLDKYKQLYKKILMGNKGII